MKKLDMFCTHQVFGYFKNNIYNDIILSAEPTLDCFLACVADQNNVLECPFDKYYLYSEIKCSDFEPSIHHPTC